MRTKIDYGVDLGTTNSAIARMENGEPIIKKSDTLKDTTPSCVYFNKKQIIQVGDLAYNAILTENTRSLKNLDDDNKNGFIEFKRTMGTTHSYNCINMGQSFSSEELSAEILKKLKNYIQDEQISSIVITVPAKFLNPQKEATIMAAKMAGFKHIELLQEPVAAATAYGLSSKSKDGYWVVFDFGGGTFDAGLLKIEEGIITVKDTEGDNWLGGKNIDYAIIDEVFIPYLQLNYLVDNILQDQNKKEILRNALKGKAEELKIQMSFQDSYSVLSELGDLPFEDENGEEPELDILVTQEDLRKVLSPIFQKSIDITKDLLKRNNLKEEDLDSLILVGGPTYSPILRQMLREQITEKIDTSIDPMTAVARGAALFASTISISEEVLDETRDRTKLQLEIKYEATSVEVEELINIKILKDKTEGTIPENVFAEIIRSDGAWSSGKKQIGDKAILFDVLLNEGKSNSFEIKLYDNQGNIIDSQPNQFTILQGIGGLDNMTTLPYCIGIGAYFKTDDKDLLKPVKGLEKNKPIGNNGLVGVANGLKTRKVVRPGVVDDIIRIPIYQGDYNAEGTNLIYNNFIYDVIITGESLPRLLPEGSDVDLTLKVNRSEQIEVSAYFPSIDHTETVLVEIKQAEPPKEEFIAKELKNAKRSAQQYKVAEIASSIQELENQLENERGSADGRLRIMDNLRQELLKLEQTEKDAEYPKIEKELKDAFYDLEDLFKKIKDNRVEGNLNIDLVDANLAEFRDAIENVIKNKDIRLAKELIAEISSVDFHIRSAVTGNAMDAQYIQHINESFESYQWKDGNKARLLINQCLKLIAEGKTTTIRPILIEIINLMPEDQKPKDTLQT